MAKDARIDLAASRHPVEMHSSAAVSPAPAAKDWDTVALFSLALCRLEEHLQPAAKDWGAVALFWHGLAPRHFWRRAAIHDKTGAWQPWLQLLSGPLVFLLIMNVLLRPLLVLAEWVRTTGVENDWRRATLVAYYMAYHLHDSIRGMLTSVTGISLLLGAWGLALPLTAIGLNLLSSMIAGCRVPMKLVLRVVAYMAGPVGFWLAVLLSAAVAISATVRGFHGMTINCEKYTEWWMQPATWAPVDEYVWLCFTPLPLLIPLLYLRGGLHHYLHLSRATWIAVATLGSVCVVAVGVITTVMRIALRRYS